MRKGQTWRVPFAAIEWSASRPYQSQSNDPKSAQVKRREWSERRATLGSEDHLPPAPLEALLTGSGIMYLRAALLLAIAVVPRLIAVAADSPAPGTKPTALRFQETPKGLSYEVAAPDKRPVRPWRGLRLGDEDIRLLRRRCREDESFKQLARSQLLTARRWMEYSPEFLASLVPPAGARFAHGFAGDPEVDQSWSYFGGGGICDLKRPGTLKSPHTGKMYKPLVEGGTHFDDGSGWVRPSDGKRFYLRGIWYSYAVRQLHAGVDALAWAYALTGQEPFAERALRILDALAALRPTTDQAATMDNRHTWVLKACAADPTFRYAAFCYMGNLGNQRMVESVLSLDLLAASPFVRADSPSAPGKTILEHIRDDYFVVLERHNRSRAIVSFQNHIQAMVLNVLAQALLFERPADVQFALDFIYAAIDNTIDPDGVYYEVSGSYSGTGLYYMGGIIRMLARYDPSRYQGDMPDGAEKPYGLRLANHPRWHAYIVDKYYREEILGRRPSYGDSGVDRTTGAPGLMVSIRNLRRAYLQDTLRQVTVPEWRDRVRKLYGRISPDVRRKASLARPWFGGELEKQYDPPDAAKGDHVATDSNLLGYKVLATLRSGRGWNRRALLFRAGCYASHGHDDAMAVFCYAHGLACTGDFGYSLYGYPDHLGFGVRAVSHPLVVVDEDPDAPRYGRNAPAASVRVFAPLKPAQIIDMEAPRLWAHCGVDEYSRQIWQVDVDDTHFYWLDIFRVHGGTVHDYVWNARFLDEPREDDGLSLEGVTCQPVDGVWVLNALRDPNRAALTYNRPGLSWGERLRPGGLMEPSNDPHEKIGYSGWKAPPGNGYGFIYDVRVGKPGKQWSACWDLGDNEARMKITMLGARGQQVIRARSPVINRPDKRHAVVIARREGDAPLSSRFVNLVQVARSNNFSVRAAQRLDSDQDGSIAVRIQLLNGMEDVILSTDSDDGEIRAGNVSLRGRYGWVRRDKQGHVVRMQLVRGTRLTCGAVELTCAKPVITWSLQACEEPGNRYAFQTPAGTPLPPPGTMLLAGSPPGAPLPYVRNHALVAPEPTCGPEGPVLCFPEEALSIGHLVIEAIPDDHTLRFTYPSELGYHPDTGTFNGRLLVRDEDPRVRTHIRRLVPDDAGRVSRTAEVESVEGFHVGDSVRVMMLQPGDQLQWPQHAVLTTGP